jgi:hypothetical protein
LPRSMEPPKRPKTHPAPSSLQYPMIWLSLCSFPRSRKWCSPTGCVSRVESVVIPANRDSLSFCQTSLRPCGLLDSPPLPGSLRFPIPPASQHHLLARKKTFQQLPTPAVAVAPSHKRASPVF